MPTPYEQRLLEMSRRANAVDTEAQPPLPDLNLQALLSPQAAFEVTAAEMLSTPQVDLVRQQSRRMQERIAAQQEATVAAQLIATAPPLPSIESIFMASAAREIGMDAVDAMAYAVASTNDFGIEYDLDLDADTGRTVPNESARFQIGRESPPYRPFSASREMQDGVEVGRRTNGRFEVNGRLAALPHIPYEPRAARMVQAPIVKIDTSPSTYVAPVMSALDVVSGDSFDNI